MLKIIVTIFIIISFTIPLIATETDYTCADKWPNASLPYHFTPNKCGPDSPLADIVPNRFGSVDLGSSCNKHDRCWMELEHLNQYGKCELRFAKDLVKACAKAEKCFHTTFGRHCIPNPIEAAACEGIIVPAYTSAAAGGILLRRLKKSRDEQKEFEKCVEEHGYNKRPTQDKK